DNLGRVQYSYLPYVPQSGNTNDGSFKTDPFNSQQTFYQNNTLNPGAIGESIYYNQAVFEPSPLNRTARAYAPGNSWAQTGGNHPIAHQYLLNTVADSVMNWSMGGGLLPVTSAVYAAGELSKDVITDEAGRQSIAYKDREGHVILNKIQYASNPGTGHDGWLCTYYIYDYLGNLRVVVPPLAVQAIAGNPDLSPVAGELCFIYRYDAKHRLIVKKVPGADSTEMIYDLRNRLVFSRDGNMKLKNNWLVTFYDTLNRPIETALYNSTATRATLQASMNTATSNTQSISYTFPGVADLVVASYDARPQYQATNSISFEAGFDSGAGGTTDAVINSSLDQGTTTITATNPLPSIPTSALTPLTYTFYDKYNFTGVQTPLTTDFSKPQAGTNPYAEPLTATSSMTKGMVTGTKVKVLGTPDGWLTATIYYNDKGRVIQTISDNISGAQDVTTTLYDFNGKVLSTYLRHKNQRCGPTPQTTVLTMMGYDAAGRLTSIKKRLNDTTTLERTIATNDYDELGRLKTKKLGINGTSAPIEQLSYEYNIRGWLRGINKTFVNTAGSTSNWFGQELDYDAGFVNNQYNGNIAGIKWKSRSNSIARAYGYSYDNTNRLTVAD
ncbi:DUF6443 domain-containing protein, partial [Chitinophaga niastensis]|uniref:DUF6443 domain-containing protein n=1 Tax=Chitinophaga niastensis TaxID=536980 RepID=UPI001FEBE7E5